MKLTLENKKRAVEIAASGASPLPFLRSLGIKNPSATWCLIKKGLQNADPETFAKLPASFRKVTPELVAKVDGPVVMETTEGEQVQMVGGVTITKDKMKIMNPYLSNGMSISAIYDEELGEFYRNQRDGDKSMFIEWRTGYGDEVILSVDVWKMMMDRLPEILKVLGVSA